MAFDLLVKYKNGKGDTVDKIISSVNECGFLRESKLFYFDKNGYKSFMPPDNIIYFGREFDWNN